MKGNFVHTGTMSAALAVVAPERGNNMAIQTQALVYVINVWAFQFIPCMYLFLERENTGKIDANRVYVSGQNNAIHVCKKTILNEMGSNSKSISVTF